MVRYEDSWSARKTRARPWQRQASQILFWCQRRLAAYFAEEYRLFLEIKSRPDSTTRLVSAWSRRRLFTISNALLLLWLAVLYWGEISIFSSTFEGCSWSFEKWPSTAQPHHLVLVADPQLVDPHTYPGRPWPLSTLTVKYTDLYMRRSYSRIQRSLDPDTIVFLGDLFDGGREWSTNASISPDPRYRSYGDLYWQNEYRRFAKIFFHPWRNAKLDSIRAPKTRRVIANIPGNHDLGFSTGIQLPVRNRFNAYFGTGNSVEVIGNHTFVSLDTVSLSAKESDGSDLSYRLMEPTDRFLFDFGERKQRAITHHLRAMKGEQTLHVKRDHAVLDLKDAAARLVSFDKEVYKSADLPTLLFSHVPLYRDPGTPCGPLRERHPPTPPPPGQTTPINPDIPNAIPYAYGYQYQNVLTLTLTTDILSKLGGPVDYAFSGDDHDYCEVLHTRYSSSGSGIREITVKSLSWAMGVKRPGFVMVSLWNPINGDGSRISKGASTVQTHLCLLPNQLALFMVYACLLLLTLLSLLVHAWKTSQHSATSILPSHKAQSTKSEYELFDQMNGQNRQYGQPEHSLQISRSSSLSSAENGNRVSARYTGNSRAQQGGSPTYGMPASFEGSHRPGMPLVPLPFGGYAEAFGDRPLNKKDDDVYETISLTRKDERMREQSRAKRTTRAWLGGILHLGWKVMIVYSILLLN